MNIEFEKAAVILGIIIVAVLAVKYLKQFIYLSFALLSLKVAWAALAILAVVLALKKKARSPRE